MNYMINDLPERTLKPRDKGITMVMDKGLSLRQVEDFIEIGELQLLSTNFGAEFGFVGGHKFCVIRGRGL